MTTDTIIRFQPGAEPGDRLTRHYGGKNHVVDVRDDGFHYAGKAYASLSKIAESITGSSTNGPLWFGIRGRRPGTARAQARPQVALPKMIRKENRPQVEDFVPRRLWP